MRWAHIRAYVKRKPTRESDEQLNTTEDLSTIPHRSKQCTEKLRVFPHPFGKLNCKLSVLSSRGCYWHLYSLVNTYSSHIHACGGIAGL